MLNNDLSLLGPQPTYLVDLVAVFDDTTTLLPDTLSGNTGLVHNGSLSITNGEVIKT